jgi:integrase
MSDRADKTFMNERADTLTFIHYAESAKFIPQGSFAYDEIKRIKLRPGDRATCTPEGLAKMILFSEHLRDEVCISLGAHAGLRHEEITRFRLCFADMENRVISLPPFYLLTKVTKVEMDRTIPIQPVLYDRLKKLIDSGFPPDDFVMRVTNWAERLRVIKKNAGVTVPRNAFRHGYASHRKQLTQNPIQTAEEMGTSVLYLKRNYAVPKPTAMSLAWFAV